MLPTVCILLQVAAKLQNMRIRRAVDDWLSKQSIPSCPSAVGQLAHYCTSLKKDADVTVDGCPFWRPQPEVLLMAEGFEDRAPSAQIGHRLLLPDEEIVAQRVSAKLPARQQWQYCFRGHGGRAAVKGCQKLKLRY